VAQPAASGVRAAAQNHAACAPPMQQLRRMRDRPHPLPCSWQTNGYFDWNNGYGHNAVTDIWGVNGSCWQQLAIVKSTSSMNFWVDQTKGATKNGLVKTLTGGSFAIGGEGRGC